MENDQSQQCRDSPSYDQARDKDCKAMIEAEKFQAKITTPTGKEKSNKSSSDEPVLGDTESKSDDDFFHLTCHIEDNLIQKIEAGNYVDLEKLLPKEKTFRRNEDTQLEFVFCEGGMYLVLANERDKRINSVQCWEQAFRVYAMIYCSANPNRAKEIWQYISVINTAAASYQWDNVASYDYTFQHLMEFNPARSWATTYNQMWNLCMKDPISRNASKAVNYSFASGNKSHGFSGATESTSSVSNSSMGGSSANSNNNNLIASVGPKKKSKSNYCWNFNKGVKCKYGNRCRFVERCSYCDSPGHPIVNCPKASEKDKEAAAIAGKQKQI